jgi:hypothetical protein
MSVKSDLKQLKKVMDRLPPTSDGLVWRDIEEQPDEFWQQVEARACQATEASPCFHSIQDSCARLGIPAPTPQDYWNKHRDIISEALELYQRAHQPQGEAHGPAPEQEDDTP